ncbi:N-acetyltransferase [Pseudoclavibacter endophyticus]|uniref:GNAT family N-acetyltransferase n=1 Tax=Pseudoclavibacter endophyticus TaxID=1778590 RepID=A0A6H9WAA5_9MICO|nr:GNAT family N-acetyltransferase [Pseudoclavibacter endophyticus]KAB1646747.1 GNAT family N-acetyltransferase [Pseudoclavibacter endophyticus]GGA75917.1 N-acetyltransferase [Pseudoclavibacter endophyticus]
MRVTVRAVEPGDRADWDRLYVGYARFNRVEQTDEMRDRVWGWLLDDEHPVRAFVAVAPDGELIGLVHYHAFPRPLAASTGCYIDDLFVAPEGRRSDAATRLLKAVADAAESDGRTLLRGVTRSRNYRARVIYDRFATRTDWVVYERTPNRQPDGGTSTT